MTANVPVDTGYQVFVDYRPTAAAAPGLSVPRPGTVDVTAGLTPSPSTAPHGHDHRPQGDPLAVTWRTNSGRQGEFTLWLVSPGDGWYGGKSSPPTDTPTTRRS